MTHYGSNYAESRKELPFGGPHDGRPHIGGHIPQNPQKDGVVMRFQAISKKILKNDNISKIY